MAEVNQPQSLNSIVFGLLVGFLLPVIFFFLYFLFRIHSTDFTGYFRFLIESKKLVHVMSLSVFPNLIPFLLFVNSSRFRAGRGVLGATIGLAILIFILKFV
jgi:hypothetical protein